MRPSLLAFSALLLPILLALQPLARAQGPDSGRIAVEARFEPAKAAPGETVHLVFDVRIEDGYHLTGSKGEFGAPTLAQPDPAAETEVAGATREQVAASAKDFALGGPLQVPPGERHVHPDYPDMVSWYLVGKTTLRQPVKVAAGASPGKRQFVGELTTMACTEEMCDPAFTQTVKLELEVLAGGPAATTGAAGAAGAADGQGKPAGQASSKHTGSHQTVELRVVPATARPGEVVTVEARVELEEGWHNYGSGQAEFGGPVVLEVEAAPLVAVGTPEVPFGAPHQVGDITNFHLEGSYLVKQAFRVPEGSAAGAVPVQATFRYMACDDNMCETEVAARLATHLTVEAGAVREAHRAVPAPAAGGGDGVGGGTAASRSGVGDANLWLYLLGAVGAGLFALVMPCTYPMIPITVSFFTKQAEQRGGSVLPLALIYGGGIIVSFLVVGLLVGLVGLDIVDFASNGWVNLALAALFVFFALSLFGLVELRPPQFLLRQATDASRKGGVLGVFLMGITLCVTSFTCTAPALGAMLAFGTQTGDMGRLLLGMGVFGLTMAVPFVVLSLVPGRLPRGGAWMNTAKVMFGFVELAAALKFFSITDVSWHLQMLPREVFLTLWAGLFVVAGVYCLGLVKLKGESGEIGGGRFVTGIASIVFAFYCLHGANGYRLDNFIMAAFEPPYLASRVSGKGHEIVDNDFDAAVGRAQESGRLLLVNFTGYT